MKKQVHCNWKYAAIILSIISLGLYLHLRETEKAIDGLFQYRISVIVLGEDTKKPIEHPSVHGPTMSSQDIIRHTSGMGGGSDGEVTISGMASKPQEWGFSATGYERFNIIIDSSSPSPIRITLKPKQDEQVATPDEE